MDEHEEEDKEDHNYSATEQALTNGTVELYFRGQQLLIIGFLPHKQRHNIGNPSRISSSCFQYLNIEMNVEATKNISVDLLNMSLMSSDCVRS